MDFSAEELNFISDLFKPEVQEVKPNHKLTLQSSVPAGIAHLLSNASLTLLAKVAHYQLWFPLDLKIDPSGVINPTLSAPEVIDTKGTQRSWRWSQLNIKSEGFYIESISSTGIFLKPLKDNSRLGNMKNVQFTLPNEECISIDIERIRQNKSGMAAKITRIITGKEQLRTYLFEEHKRQYSALYENGQLVNEIR